MADFVQKSETKTATRELTTPIADVDTLTGIVQNVIANNPFSCVAYMTAGVNHAAVEKGKETYTARVAYEDAEGKSIGAITIRTSNVAAFNSIAARILADAQNATDMGGSGHRDTEGETYSVTLKCHDPSGELYNVVMGRDAVRLNSYEDDAIRTKVETWADGVVDLG